MYICLFIFPIVESLQSIVAQNPFNMRNRQPSAEEREGAGLVPERNREVVRKF